MTATSAGGGLSAGTRGARGGGAPFPCVDQVTVNEYTPGRGISGHVDTHAVPPRDAHQHRDVRRRLHDLGDHGRGRRAADALTDARARIARLVPAALITIVVSTIWAAALLFSVGLFRKPAAA